jgi:hypothetical protein
MHSTVHYLLHPSHHVTSRLCNQIGLVPALWAKLLAESENILFLSTTAEVTPIARSLVCYFIALGLACCVGYLVESYFINRMGQRIAQGACCTVEPCVTCHDLLTLLLSYLQLSVETDLHLIIAQHQHSALPLLSFPPYLEPLLFPPHPFPPHPELLSQMFQRLLTRKISYFQAPETTPLSLSTLLHRDPVILNNSLGGLSCEYITSRYIK